MRIISGKHKGRKFMPPAKMPARPTTDIAKEALFNILQNNFDFEEITYLDLFSGTGNIAYELFSRGCKNITMIDLSPICVNFQKKMAEILSMNSVSTILLGDAIQFINTCPKRFDLIFAGPPYALEIIDELPDKVLNSRLVDEDTWFILETSHKHNFSNHPQLLQVRNYGQTHFWIFQKAMHA
jgi:16S rRNA (guanine966-N2)-methyltransferase